MMAQQEEESVETAARRIARYELIILRIQFAILQVRREAQSEGLSIDAINHSASQQVAAQCEIWRDLQTQIEDGAVRSSRTPKEKGLQQQIARALKAYEEAS